MNTFNEIIKKIGEELGIKVTLLSDNWLTILEKNNEIHYITGYKFDLNNHGIGNIMDDKGLFHDLMVYKNIPVIEQINIYKRYDKEKVFDYFKKNNNTLIVKGNIGTCGNCVYLVNNKDDLKEKLNSLLRIQDTVSISPYYHIKNEYRVIILNNKERLVYGKVKPIIVGNGKDSLEKLAISFNSYFKKHNIKNIDCDYIPKLNEKIELDFRFNLSNGANLFTNIDNKLKRKIVDLAIKTARSLDIMFGSIDIIHTEKNELLVLEANSGVMMNNYIKLNKNGYNDAYNIYRDAVKLMFKEK